MLQIKNLNKHYGKKQALFDFEMTFKNGVYGLLGPNGAGKSTLMNSNTRNSDEHGRKHTCGEAHCNAV